MRMPKGWRRVGAGTYLSKSGRMMLERSLYDDWEVYKLDDDREWNFQQIRTATAQQAFEEIERRERT